MNCPMISLHQTSFRTHDAHWHQPKYARAMHHFSHRDTDQYGTWSDCNNQYAPGPNAWNYAQQPIFPRQGVAACTTCLQVVKRKRGHR